MDRHSCDLKRNETRERRLLGDDLYHGYFKMARWSAQRALLSQSGVNIPVLSWMYGFPKGIPTGFAKEEWRGSWVAPNSASRSASYLSLQAPLRSSSKASRKKSRRSRSGGAGSSIPSLSPSRSRSSFARTMLHHRRSFTTSTISSALPHPRHRPVIWYRVRSLLDDRLRRTPPKNFELAWGANQTPPPGTKSGVTRYEAWRLPPVAGEAGFVSVALVADLDVSGGLIDQIDRRNQDWADEQTRATGRHWW